MLKRSKNWDKNLGGRKSRRGGPNIMGDENHRAENCRGTKSQGVENWKPKWGPINVWGPKFFESRNLLGAENVCVQKLFRAKSRWGSKIFGGQNIYVL